MSLEGVEILACHCEADGVNRSNLKIGEHRLLRFARNDRKRLCIDGEKLRNDLCG